MMIVRRGRSLLDDARALQQEIAASRGQVTGTLVLGVVPTATAWAAQLADQVHQEYPRILLRIEAASSMAIQQRLYDGTIDAGITYADSMGQELVTLQPLYEESYVLLAPEAMVGGLGDQITWAQAAELPLSLLDQQMQNRRILDRVFAEQGLKPAVISESNGFVASIVRAKGGTVATILPRALAEALGNPEGTRVLGLIEPEQARPICIATLDRTPELSTVRALKEVVASLVESEMSHMP
jgi:DNA-binding transcriptional LysR family regulator